MKPKWEHFLLLLIRRELNYFVNHVLQEMLNWEGNAGTWDVFSEERKKILQIAFLIFSTSFQNLLTAPSLKVGSTTLNSSFHLKAHTPKKYIIQTGNSFLLGKETTTMKTNLAKQGDNAGVLQVHSILFQT